MQIHVYMDVRVSNVMWSELGYSNFSCNVGRKLLFSNKLSDYGATKVSLYST